MSFYPQPNRPEIDAFFASLARLTVPQWATIVTRYVGRQSDAADASDLAAAIVAGSDLHISKDQRKARVSAALEAYDRIPATVGLLPDVVHHDGERVFLRGLVEAATLAAVQALLVKEELASRPQVWSALTHPFAGFIELGA